MAEHQKYRITDRIDSGGMAEVFRGVAESLAGFKKNVAIKRILPNLCKNRKFISMFLDEARLSLHLQHANIVGVFDIGRAEPEGGEEATYFIVMEFVDGLHLKGIVESLRRQNRPMKVAHALYIMMEVCKGLAYAHDLTDAESNRPLGIVHRDISPPNILISKMGEVKLVDFGLAKATSQIESTEPGMVKGKFSYLSPESALGQEVDRRADIFACGILLYELLTGKRLFFGENDYATVELVRQARVPSIAQQNSEVEPELEQIVRKALARDVEQRFQTAGEMQDAIAHYLFSRGLKVTSRDISQLVREARAEKQKTLPPEKVQKQKGNLIDTLIQEEMLKFTSIEEEQAAAAAAAAAAAKEPSGPGARPLSPDDIAAAPLDGNSFVDTRQWMDEVDDGPTKTDSQNGAAGRAIAAATVRAPRDAGSRGRRKEDDLGSLEDLLEGGSRRRAASPHGSTTKTNPAAQKIRPPQMRKLMLIVSVGILVSGSGLLYIIKVLLGRH